MLSKERLGTYLNDHLAGATAGGELAQKISDDNSGTDLGVFLAELASEIEQDRRTLEDLMTRLGIEKSPVKAAAGWIFEKFSRMKLSDALTGSADLKHLLEFETLSLGIEGKLVMWRALQQVSDQDTELATADLGGLMKRAEGQRAALEERRLQAATAALTG
ncbi:MAG: hypothetical protein ACT4NY_34325 [Pseudonocardiales bacterium]